MSVRVRLGLANPTLTMQAGSEALNPTRTLTLALTPTFTLTNDHAGGQRGRGRAGGGGARGGGGTAGCKGGRGTAGLASGTGRLTKRAAGCEGACHGNYYYYCLWVFIEHDSMARLTEL